MGALRKNPFHWGGIDNSWNYSVPQWLLPFLTCRSQIYEKEVKVQCLRKHELPLNLKTPKTNKWKFFPMIPATLVLEEIVFAASFNTIKNEFIAV